MKKSDFTDSTKAIFIDTPIISTRNCTLHTDETHLRLSIDYFGLFNNFGQQQQRQQKQQQ